MMKSVVFVVCKSSSVTLFEQNEERGREQALGQMIDEECGLRWSRSQIGSHGYVLTPHLHLDASLVISRGRFRR